MFPSSWPRWTIIPLGFVLVVFAVLTALVVEPAAQAIAPQPTPTPTFFRLAYAAPLSGGCVDCHTNEARLRASGGSDSDVQRALIQADEVMSLHGRLGCVTCHGGNGQSDDRTAAHQGLVSNPSDYREADEVCLACHADVRTDIPEKHIHTPHERILWGIHEEREVCACSNCHGPVAHGVAPVGSHEGLAAYCIDCHEQRNVPPERLQCTGCHISPHDVTLDCETCHTSTQTWASTRLALHPMALNGRHAELHCFECHTQPLFRTISGFTCRDCHTAAHEFGTDQDCGDCHIDGTAWNQVREGAFDHAAIWEGYTVGTHAQVSCRGCHLEGYQALPSDCSACHQQNP